MSNFTAKPYLLLLAILLVVSVVAFRLYGQRNTPVYIPPAPAHGPDDVDIKTTDYPSISSHLNRSLLGLATAVAPITKVTESQRSSETPTTPITKTTGTPKSSETSTTPITKTTGTPQSFATPTKGTPLPGVVSSSNYCCEVSKNSSLEELCGSTGDAGAKYPNCTCIDFMYCRFVFVTAFSSNHFIEAHDMIGSVHQFLPNTKIIVYDLGMNDEQRSKASTYCNVEVRKFDFDKYPPHVKNLMNYAWKPLLAEDAMKDHELISYGDSSVRMKSSNMKPAFQSLLKFPFLSGAPLTGYYAGGAMISFTHDGMIDYFNYPPSRSIMGHLPYGVQGGSWLLWGNSIGRKRILDLWVDCALHVECIAPEGAKLQGCSGPTTGGRYVGCHRFDQSAINLILVKEFGIHVQDSAVNTHITGPLIRINRANTNFFTVRMC